MGIFFKKNEKTLREQPVKKEGNTGGMQKIIPALNRREKVIEIILRGTLVRGGCARPGEVPRFSPWTGPAPLGSMEISAKKDFSWWRHRAPQAGYPPEGRTFSTPLVPWEYSQEGGFSAPLHFPLLSHPLSSPPPLPYSADFCYFWNVFSSNPPRLIH